jgi:hypothetical protein
MRLEGQPLHGWSSVRSDAYHTGLGADLQERRREECHVARSPRTIVTEVKQADDVDDFWIVSIEGRRTILVSEDGNSLGEAELRQAMFQMDTSAKNDTT